MNDKKAIYIISDAHEEKNVSFGFEGYAKTLTEIIAYKENKTPLTIGVYGRWGTGKTALMKRVVYYLTESEDYKDENLYRRCKTVWFQAWKYNNEDEILAALIAEIFKVMDNPDVDFFEKCKSELKNLNIPKLAGQISKKLTGIDISEAVLRLDHKDKLGFYDIFQECFDNILWKYLECKEKDDAKSALVIFIDDLDRCPEPKIIKVLETIKLFMDKKGCIFVIGAADDIIQKAIKKNYEDDAERFMDKIVQVHFPLPNITPENFKKFVSNISPKMKDAVLPHLELICPALDNNPRQIKRFLNNLSLRTGILRNRDLKIDFNHVLFFSIIEYCYRGLYKELNEKIDTLDYIREDIKKLHEHFSDNNRWDFSDEDFTNAKIRDGLRKYIEDKKLARIIKELNCGVDILQQLMTMSKTSNLEKSLENKEGLEDKAKRISHAVKSSAEFDKMVKIPKGEFIYQKNGKAFIDKDYEIDIYPVTNGQYREFIEDGGYKEDDYWSKEGIEWREKKEKKQPEYWEDSKFNGDYQPVVGVSFYEAEAYAKWAGKELPTEMQWERAARGTDGREYPWGNEFDKEKCNCRESGHGKTTRVNMYHNGVSPEGCYDMAGNVWEWTASFYDKDKKNRYVLRGGSWILAFPDYFRCAYRYDDFPGYGFDDVGFRCVRTKL